jgi:putative membrane protein
MKRLNKKEWKKTTKYIAGSAGAVSLAVASCVAGITGSTDVTKYDKEYLAGDDKASDTDATTVMNTDELADTLAENVNMTEKDVDKEGSVLSLSPEVQSPATPHVRRISFLPR